MDKKTKKEHVLTLFMLVIECASLLPFIMFSVGNKLTISKFNSTVRNCPLKMYGENNCSIEIARGNEIVRN